MKFQELFPSVHVEDYTNEFKARLLTGVDKSGEDNELKWLREIVAFANTQGGDLYVGVNDKTLDLEPLTHSEVDSCARLAYQKIEERIEPEIAVRIQEVPLGKQTPDAYVLKIRVDKSKATPVYVHAHGVPACYIRQFGRAKIATPEQIAQLVIESTRAAYDSLFSNEPYREEDFKKLSERYEKTNPGKKLSAKILESIGFIDDSGFLSRGALLFKDNCSNEVTLAKCTLYPGLDKGGDSVTASETYRGCLFDVIDSSIAFVRNHSTTGYRKTPTSRVDVSSFPYRSLFEGTINAFAHRNYFISGTEVQFDVFPDRLEITSPGSLLGGKVVERETDISRILPKRRNEVLCRVFELVHDIEAKGTGFDKITEDYLLAKPSQKPFISCDGESFTLTLPDLTFEQGVIGEDNPYPEIHIASLSSSLYGEKILSCCYLKPRTAIEIASFLGVSVSSHLRNDFLGPLVREGYLYQSQQGRSFVYLTNREKIGRNKGI